MTRFTLLKINGIVYKILWLFSNALWKWCLDQSEIVSLQRTEGAMVRGMCNMKLVERRLTRDLMHMLELKEMIDQLAEVNSICCSDILIDSFIKSKLIAGNCRWSKLFRKKMWH